MLFLKWTGYSKIKLKRYEEMIMEIFAHADGLMSRDDNSGDSIGRISKGV